MSNHWVVYRELILYVKCNWKTKNIKQKKGGGRTWGTCRKEEVLWGPLNQLLVRQINCKVTSSFLTRCKAKKQDFSLNNVFQLVPPAMKTQGGTGQTWVYSCEYSASLFLYCNLITVFSSIQTTVNLGLPLHESWIVYLFLKRIHEILKVWVIYPVSLILPSEMPCKTFI